MMTEDLLVRTLEERRGQGILWTSYGQQKVVLLDHTVDGWPAEELQLVTSRLSCLHRLVVLLQDDWTASYLVSAVSALFSLSPSVLCSVELTDAAESLSLNCSWSDTAVPADTADGAPTPAVCSLGRAGLTGLRQAIEKHQDNQLSQIVPALQVLHIPPEDILRVTTAAALLLSHNQRQNVVTSAELLGVPPDQLNNLLVDNQNFSGPPTSLGARLSHFLTVRTIQSIVKKVNRTIKRRHALKILCQTKMDNKKVGRTTIKIVNPSAPPVEGESCMVRLESPWLPEAVTEMFHDKSRCNFGFASHLFSDCDTSISADWTPPAVRVFCLEPACSLVSQVREMALLEAVVLGMEDRLWTCYTTAQFSTEFRCLARRECEDEAETVFSVLDLVADCDHVEICQDSGTVMLGLPAQQRLDLALRDKREESARRIQTWWRLRRYPPHLMTSLEESDLIETVLMKYETLQRQSESLVYSFADRTVRRGDSLDNLMTETLALPADVLETENSYQNIQETHPAPQLTDQADEEQEFMNEEIVLRTSQLYGIDLVRFILCLDRVREIQF